jgi:phage-related protein
MSYEGWLPLCFICKQSVNLELSKTDEHGRAVHENCYVWHVLLKKPQKIITPPEHVYDRARRYSLSASRIIGDR